MPRTLGSDDVLRLTAPAEPQLSPDTRLVTFTVAGARLFGRLALRRDAG